MSIFSSKIQYSIIIDPLGSANGGAYATCCYFFLKLGLYDIAINFYFIQNWSSFSKAAWSQYAVLCAGSAKRSNLIFYQFTLGRFILFYPIFSFNWFRLIHTVWSSASFDPNSTKFNLSIHSSFSTHSI